VRDGSGFIKKMNKLGQTSFSDRLLSAEKIPKTRPDPILIGLPPRTRG
jgi:hypothetical protein